VTGKEILNEEANRLLRVMKEVESLGANEIFSLGASHEIGVASTYIRFAADKLKKLAGAIE
jgi:hypothetical protein